MTRYVCRTRYLLFYLHFLIRGNSRREQDGYVARSDASATADFTASASAYVGSRSARGYSEVLDRRRFHPAPALLRARPFTHLNWSLSGRPTGQVFDPTVIRMSWCPVDIATPARTRRSRPSRWMVMVGPAACLLRRSAAPSRAVNRQIRRRARASRPAPPAQRFGEHNGAAPGPAIGHRERGRYRRRQRSSSS
jgi:hypothetical protein